MPKIEKMEKELKQLRKQVEGLQLIAEGRNDLLRAHQNKEGRNAALVKIEQGQKILDMVKVGIAE